MGKYLLAAEDAELDAWKAAAKERGMKFAEWMRQACKAYAATPSSPDIVRSEIVPTATTAYYVPVSPVAGGKRTYEPDFKEGGDKPKKGRKPQ